MMKQNDDKTEFIILGSGYWTSHVSHDPIRIGDSLVTPSLTARNLGATFDVEMNMLVHIKKVCQASYFHFRNIANIRPALTERAAQSLIHALITSRLDSCNSLYIGLPVKSTNLLQAVQHVAARLLTGTKKYDHITPVLQDLHWLPVTFRIK